VACNNEGKFLATLLVFNQKCGEHKDFFLLNKKSRLLALGGMKTSFTMWNLDPFDIDD